MIKNKTSPENLIKWFHDLVKGAIIDNLHKDCDKRIANLKNIIRAVSGNNSIQINDLEYSRITLFTISWNNTFQMG